MFLHLSISHSVHRRGVCPGGVYLSMHWADTPSGQMPPAGTPPLAETPGQTHPLSRHPPLQVDTPPG